jgi:site-specific recombinase XerD
MALLKGHADIKTTMIYVSLGKTHIREQVERLNGIHVPTMKNLFNKSNVA